MTLQIGQLLSYLEGLFYLINCIITKDILNVTINQYDEIGLLNYKRGYYYEMYYRAGESRKEV